MAQQWKLRQRARVEVDNGNGPNGAQVLLDTYSATLYECNGTAWTMLEALSGGATIDELVERVVGDFDVTPDAARRDVERFVLQLQQMGLADGHA